MEEINQKIEEIKANESPKKGKNISTNLFKKGHSIKSSGRHKLTPEERLFKQATREVAMRILKKHAPKAAKNIVKLGNKAKNETVKLNANKDVLDRVGIGVKPSTVIPIQINFEEARNEFK